VNHDTVNRDAAFLTQREAKWPIQLRFGAIPSWEVTHLSRFEVRHQLRHPLNQHVDIVAQALDARDAQGRSAALGHRGTSMHPNRDESLG
jgi:hypothetical protein